MDQLSFFFDVDFSLKLFKWKFKLIGLYHWIGLLKACLQGVCVNACLLGISLLAYVLASHSSGATSFYV
jgi:hypothetical protein